MLRCPKCGSELLAEGYPDELGFQRYRCPNGCEFGTPLSWRIKNAIGVFFVATLMVLMLFVSLAVSVVRRLKS